MEGRVRAGAMAGTDGSKAQLEGADSMDSWPGRVPTRLLTLITVLVLAVGAAACGSDDDGNGGSAAADSATTDAGSNSGNGGQATGGSDEQQVEALFADMKKAIANGDADEVCGLMGEQAQAQVASTDPQGGDCKKVFTRLFKSNTVAEDLNPAFKSVQVSGDRAIVKATPSKGDKTPQEASFVKEGDEWKVNLWLTD
jgi:ketosteroid isomerase-like protein